MKNPYTIKYDLTNCDGEPIHIVIQRDDLRKGEKIRLTIAWKQTVFHRETVPRFQHEANSIAITIFFGQKLENYYFGLTPSDTTSLN